MTNITLDIEELQRVTGYKRPAEQLEELKRQGFFRARRSRTGDVILERSHYDAICGGLKPDKAPKLHNPFERKLRAV